MKNPGTVTKVVQVTIVLLMTMVRLDAQTDRELTSAQFANKILTLYWTDLTTDIARLRDDGDCIYTGHLERDARSSVLVTGCEDGDTSIQIQSTVVGDMIFTVMKNGSIVYPTFDHEDEYEDYLENDDFDAEFGVIAEKNGRHKREDYSDEDYYYDEPAENPEFDENYPDLGSNEIADMPPIPPKFILNINVYLDRSWYKKFGNRGSETKARQVLRHAQELYVHPSLEIKMDLQFGNRIYKSRAPKLQPNTRGLKDLGQYLQGPYKMKGTFPVAHVHLTTRRSRAVGFAVLDSICDEKPKAIVKFKKNLLRTAMTVAHELGHVLGMQHDFIALEGKREVCQENRKTGGTIMNYGSKRDVWSNCSNEDFRVFYNRIFVKKGAFCLEDPSAKVCKCNGLVDIAGGECKVVSAALGGYWCYVDENSTCRDKKVFFGNYISNIPCSSGDRSQAVIGCRPDQWQCKSSKKCISKSHRCDGRKRHCSDGSDEANCPFEF